MDDRAQPEVPADVLSEGVAVLGPDGLLEARNDPMRSFLRSAGCEARTTLAQLGLDADELAQLTAGSPVQFERAGERFSVRLVRRGDRTWFFCQAPIANDVLVQVRLAAARCRALGGLAAVVMHDLANMLAAGMGIGEVLRVHGPRAEDLAQLEDLMASARQGVTLGRGLARMLGRGPRSRSPIRMAEVLEEVAGVLGKHCSRRGVHLSIAISPVAATIRFEIEVATQALIHAVLFGLDHKVQSITVRSEIGSRTVAGGRPRQVASAIVALHGLDSGIRAALKAMFAGAVGSLQAARLLGENAAGLMLAGLMIGAAGGELLSREAGDVVELDFAWPLLSP